MTVVMIWLGFNVLFVAVALSVPQRKEPIPD